MREVQTVVGWVFILTFWVVLGTSLYQYFDNEPPIEISSGSLISFDHSTRVAIIEYVGTRNRHCPGVIHRWLEDGFVATLPDIEVSSGGLTPVREEGAEYAWRVPLQVPPFSSGLVRLRSEVTYFCNSFQHLVPLRVSVPDVHFEVPEIPRIQNLLEGG